MSGRAAGDQTHGAASPQPEQEGLVQSWVPTILIRPTTYENYPSTKSTRWRIASSTGRYPACSMCSPLKSDMLLAVACLRVLVRDVHDDGVTVRVWRGC